jgi:hypothetical protein
MNATLTPTARRTRGTQRRLPVAATRDHGRTRHVPDQRPDPAPGCRPPDLFRHRRKSPASQFGYHRRWQRVFRVSNTFFVVFSPPEEAGPYGSSSASRPSARHRAAASLSVTIAQRRVRASRATCAPTMSSVRFSGRGTPDMAAMFARPSPPPCPSGAPSEVEDGEVEAAEPFEFGDHVDIGDEATLPKIACPAGDPVLYGGRMESGTGALAGGTPGFGAAGVPSRDAVAR